MLKARITDISLFANFLSVISKFVQQCQFILTTEKVSVYCRSPVFSSARLLLDSNLLQLDEGQGCDKVSICIRDVIAFRSAISIVQTVEDVKEIEIQLEDVKGGDNETVIKSVRYKSENGGGFRLITIDFDVIKNLVSKDTSMDLERDWSFNVNPRNLDIIQNKTGSIVNMDEASAYIYPKDGKVLIELTSKKSAAINSIALPLADSYAGSLDNAGFSEIAIHEGSFRIFNILKVTDEKDIDCFFNISTNVFFITSELNSEGNYIKSRLFIQMVKGK